MSQERPPQRKERMDYNAPKKEVLRPQEGESSDSNESDADDELIALRKEFKDLQLKEKQFKREKEKEELRRKISEKRKKLDLQVETSAAKSRQGPEAEDVGICKNGTLKRSETTVLLKQDNSSLNKIEFETLESNSRQEHDKNSESKEKERESTSSELQRENEPIKQPKNPLPDPPDVDFNVDDRVESTKPKTKGRKGTVTNVYPTGHVQVKWDRAEFGTSKYLAGAGGKYYVKKITE